MVPNLHDYKIIKVSSKIPIGANIIVTYTNSKSSFFNFFCKKDTNVQKYPIVYKIEENSEAYNQGLRIGHKIIKLNNYSLENKDLKTVLSDFNYEKKTTDVLTLTIL
jgi:C-terminal processing protease CtpA/Prc